MSEKRTFIRRTAGVLLTAVMALTATAAVFTWDAGGGGSQVWSNVLNWTANSGYPDDTGDDAVFPYVSGGWGVEVINEDIQDIDISADVDFYAGSTVDLQARSIAMADPTYGITITFDSDVTVASDPH